MCDHPGMCQIRRASSLIFVILAACASAPTTTPPRPTAATSEPSEALCAHVWGPREARHVDACEACEGAEPGDGIAVVENEGGIGQHDLMLADGRGWTIYEHVFEAGSGFGCDWEPGSGADGNDDWTIVTQSGDSYAREEGSCEPDGTLSQFAIVDAHRHALVASIMCLHDDEAMLTLGDDGRLTLSHCGDGEPEETFDVAAIAACWKH